MLRSSTGAYDQALSNALPPPYSFFFFNDTATTEIYTLSLHDALPIYLDPIKLATPEAFARDPELVWQWYRERRERIRGAQPNAAHQAIAKLAQCAGEFLLVTQNVDDLHERAGLAKAEMVQIHGDIFKTRCSRCHWRAELCDAHTRDDRDKSGLAGARPSIIEFSEQDGGPENGVPRCTKCDALMRPGVVWFGEPLPLHETERVESYLQRDSCGVVIVAGNTATFG